MKEIKTYLFLALIFIFIIVIVVLIVNLVKNEELIKSDALLYGMKQHNLTSCSCLDSKGQSISIGKSIINLSIG